LDVFSKNQKAINLYKKYGFELVRIKESRNNHKENMVEIYEMELILNRCEIKMG
jgi:ribosomal protein S18 acetylase RimI-like enzyme